MNSKKDREDENIARLKEISILMLEAAQESEESGYERMPFISNLLYANEVESIGDIPPLCVAGEGLKLLSRDALARVECEDRRREKGK